MSDSSLFCGRLKKEMRSNLIQNHHYYFLIGLGKYMLVICYRNKFQINYSDQL